MPSSTHHHRYTRPSPTVSAQSSPIDGVPYVTIPRITKPESLKSQPERPPFSDKSSRASNIDPSAKPYALLDHIIASPTTAPPAPPSYALPLVESSSFQLPPFLDFSFHTFAPSPGLSPTTPALPAITASPPLTLSLPILQTVEETVPKTPLPDLCQIPAFSHPNSPYVPWTSPTRREILRPLTPASGVSGFSSAYSRSYSRSGARAPEPTDESEDNSPVDGGLTKVSKGFKSFRRIFKTNVKEVAKQFSKFKRPFRPCGARPPTPQVMRHRRRISYSTSALPSPALSGATSNTNTLADWLAERQRRAMCQDADLTCGMTLDEYDRMGSWINVTHGDRGELNSSENHTLYAGMEPLKTTAGNASRTSSTFEVSTEASPRVSGSRSSSQIATPSGRWVYRYRDSNGSHSSSEQPDFIRRREYDLSAEWSYHDSP